MIPLFPHNLSITIAIKKGTQSVAKTQSKHHVVSAAHDQISVGSRYFLVYNIGLSKRITGNIAN